MGCRRWYAMFVVTGQEDLVKARIARKLNNGGVDAELFVPKRFVRERRGGGVNGYVRTMFPGYVLVGTEHIRRVSDLSGGIKGVLRFLSSGGEFQIVHPHEISKLIGMADGDGVIGESASYLNENDRVVVLAGPMKGYESEIVKLDRRRGRVAVNFFIGGEKHEIWLGIALVDRP